MTLPEIPKMTNTELREVEFDLSPYCVSLIRQLPGYETSDPRTETLKMLKSIYGLKDAPRAWRQKLHHVLIGWGMQQLKAEAELYVSHYREAGSQP